MKRVRIVVEDPSLRSIAAYYWMRFLSNEYAVLLIALFLLRILTEMFVFIGQSRLFISRKRDLLSFIALGGLFYSSGGAVGYLLIMTDPRPSPTFWYGLGLFLFACLGRLAALSALGQEHQSYLEMVVKKRLVISGIFALIRHPLLMFYLIEMFSLLLIKWNYVSLAAVVLAIVMSLYRIQQEERRLSKQFGEHFAMYRHTTKRLIPFVY